MVVATQYRAGSPPTIRRLSVPVGGIRRQTATITNRLQVSNESGGTVRLYFREPDFTNDENYLLLVGNTGFYDGPATVTEYWLRTTVGGPNTVVVAEYFVKRV